MRTKLLAGVALAAMFGASSASAQAPGFYGALDLGWHFPEGIDAESSNNAPDGSPYSWKFEPDDAYAGFARVGYRLSPSWRVELEGGYRNGGDVQSVRGDARGFEIASGLCTPGVIRSPSNPTCGAPEGTIQSATLMANIIYDFNFASFQRIVPFVGIGAGVNKVDFDVLGQLSNVGTVGPGNPAIQNLIIDDEDVAIAYQGLAGLTFNATEQLALDLTYRYLAGSDVNFVSEASAFSGGIAPGEFAGPYRDHSVTFGVRYAFAPPPPPPQPVVEPPPPPPPLPPVVPPPPPPPPPPEVVRPEQREFIVYFPFDQSILTPEAQTVVQEAANYATQGNATRIAVVGHADTSGSAAYNIRLSERRARAVADSMVGLGVNPGLITADWRGEAAPAVATGDGVREPLNRRATIDVGF